MSEGQSNFADTERELLEATGDAIAKHGVADVTTQKIADEWGRAQSLLHYYYDTKTDLVVAYIEYLHEGLSEAFEARADDPPLERLEWATVRDLCDTSQARSLALFDLHGNAPYEERYQAALNDFEDDARAFVEAAIEDGIEDGTFRDVDPETTTALLLSAHDGGILRSATLGRESDGDLIERAVERYVRDLLLAQDVREDWGGFEGGE
jgi:AcrR family transcriptional regulator